MGRDGSTVLHEVGEYVDDSDEFLLRSWYGIGCGMYWGVVVLVCWMLWMSWMSVLSDIGVSGGT